MFTGIIEALGTVKNIIRKSRDIEFVVQAPFCLELSIGDSVCINGACQTVTDFDSQSFKFFSSMETLSITNLSNLKISDKVNLERALKLGSRLDGHIVSGHIDGIGKISKIQKGDGSIKYYFEVLNKEVMQLIAKKGSIAIDGISLTVYDLTDNGFCCTVIPITIEKTILSLKSVGDIVNLETDVIAKYLDRLINSSKNYEKSISIEFLNEHGFY